MTFTAEGGGVCFVSQFALYFLYFLILKFLNLKFTLSPKIRNKTEQHLPTEMNMLTLTTSINNAYISTTNVYYVCALINVHIFTPEANFTNVTE